MRNLAYPSGGGAQVPAFGLQCEPIQAAFQQQGLLVQIQFVDLFSSKHALSFLNSDRVAENGAQFFTRTRNRQKATIVAAK
jgi:hypothetical protein